MLIKTQPADPIDVIPSYNEDPFAYKAFEAARRNFEALIPQQQLRNEAARFAWGDQHWKPVDPSDPYSETEEDYLLEQGRHPWTFNHIGLSLINLKGQRHANKSDRMAVATQPGAEQIAEQMTLALEYDRRQFSMDLFESDQWQEFLVGGTVLGRIDSRWVPRRDRKDTILQAVHPNRGIYNPDASDRRGEDLTIVGQLRDISIEGVVHSFARKSRARAERIAQLYKDYQTHAQFPDPVWGSGQFELVDFYQPFHANECRVIEVWVPRYKWVVFAHDPLTGRFDRIRRTPEEVEFEQRARDAMAVPRLELEESYEPVWWGFYFTPKGHILWQGETTARHQEHPFILGWNQKLDGKHKGIVTDVVDQQRMYNRHMGVFDEMLLSSARGVLMIPEEAIPDHMSPEDFATEYVKIRGLIVYSAEKMKQYPTAQIQQVYNNSVSVGSLEWMKLMQDNTQRATGVTDSVLGQNIPAGASGKLYEATVAQAQSTSSDHFHNFYHWINRIDHKHAQLIQQHWDTPRELVDSLGRPVVFDPEAVGSLEAYIAMADISNNAAARFAFEESLERWRQEKEITFPQFLEVSSHPKATTLKALLQQTNPLLNGQASPDQVAQLMEAALQGDQEAITLLNQAQ